MYRFDAALTTWQESGRMAAKRYYMGYAESPAWGLVVAGGWNEDAVPQAGHSIDYGRFSGHFSDCFSGRF